MKKFKIAVLTTSFALTASILGSVAFNKADASPENFDAIGSYEKIGKDKKKEDLLKYKENNEFKINKLAAEVNENDEILTTITFNKFLKKDAVEKLAKKYNIKVKQIKGRAIDKETGLRATFAISPVNGTLINEEVLEMVTRDSNPKGFIEIVAKVPNKELVNVKKDEDVFLADVSADNHLISNPKNKTMPGLFWDLEENQMVTQ